MKSLILVMALFTSLAHASDIAPETKKIIFDEISFMVAFEDEGYIRAPSKMEDFKFEVQDEFVIRVTGDSYSDWDMKDLSYDCTVNVKTKGQIKSAADLDIDCQIENENWPYWN